MANGMAARLNGWARLGIIASVVWALACPFVLGPLAKSNVDICERAQQWEAAKADSLKSPDKYDPRFDVMSPQAITPVSDGQLRFCYGGGEGFLDLRGFPYGVTDTDGWIGAIVISLLVYFAEAILPIALAWTAVLTLLGTTRWVSSGFRSAS